MSDWLKTTPVAHRGLHEATRGVIENSVLAFKAAAEKGYAIELDVQITSDGQAVVFHDYTLDRLTIQKGKVNHHTLMALSKIHLNGSAEHDTIPSLGAVIEVVANRVPLLIEIKSQRVVGPLESAVNEVLTGYQGEFAVQSFNPQSMGWFAQNAPDILRGQISTDYSDPDDSSGLSWSRKFTLRNMLYNHISKPNFIAYDINALPCLPVSIRQSLGMPVLTWTVKTEALLEKARRHADNVIFETVTP